MYVKAEGTDRPW